MKHLTDTTMAALRPLYLPPELAMEIAKHLDAYSLLFVSKVSHFWREVALLFLDKLSLAGALSAFRTAKANANHEALIYFASRIRRNERTGPPTGCLALTWACMTTCSEAVRILIPFASMPHRHQRSAQDVNPWDEPLFEAMRQQNPKALETLLTNGAPPDRIDYFGLNAGCMPDGSGGDHDHDHPTLDSPAPGIHAAIVRGFPAALKYLLNRLRDCPRQLDAVLNQGYNGYPALCVAAQVGCPDILRILLDHNTDVNQLDHSLFTPLAIAAYWGLGELVRILLDHGADMELCSRTGERPLFWAAYSLETKKGHPDVVQLLLERGANIEPVKINGDTPLLWAVENGSEQSAQVLLEHGANVNHQDEIGITPLMAAVSLDEEVPSLVQLLVKYKADLHPRDNCHRTPLHVAFQRGYDHSTRILMDAGADKSMVDGKGFTPQAYACKGPKSVDVEVGWPDLIVARRQINRT